MQEAIVLKDVHFAFNHLPVLEKVSFKIKKGDFVGVVGPNGGGKTTLLKIICGLLEPTRGKVLIFGQKPSDFYPKISYVPQISKIERDFPISLLELILLGAITSKNLFCQNHISKKQTRQKALELLKKFGLIAHQHQAFGTLSGGQAQKALIAKALISDPEIIILDEPTANIDVKGEKIVFDLIKTELKDKTILMVSHDLNFVIKDVKNIIFVDKQVACKLPEEVCEHFAVGLYHQPLLKKEKES